MQTEQRDEIEASGGFRPNLHRNERQADAESGLTEATVQQFFHRKPNRCSMLLED